LTAKEQQASSLILVTRVSSVLLCITVPSGKILITVHEVQ